ncbi:ferrous iron transport protein A [Chloroflexota bacterium]
MHGFMHRFGRRFQPEENQVTLAQMETGQSGVVVEIRGGRGITSRLSALGIRPRQRVIKIGSMFMRGPVTIQIGNAQIAIGFGMASRIIVELG